MAVLSLQFVLFAAVVAALHALWRHPIWRDAVFLLANLLFVASFTHSSRALTPLALFLIWGYLSIRVAPLMQRSTHWLVFGITTVVLFCYLKKYWFLSFLGFVEFPYFVVGLSYIFFRVMGLIIDACDQPELAAVGPVRYLNFAINFPTLVAGPIERYQTFAAPADRVTPGALGRAFERIIVGFFKIMVISHVLSTLQAGAATLTVSEASAGHRVLQSLLAFGLYPIYLYFNFSGYTDIVIGVGHFFGKTYPENFDAPFSSFSFIEFWSRWHMTLSFWLRDYVYTPMMTWLLRRAPSSSWDPYLSVAAYFLTFFLIGVWHGSTIIFAIYGLLLALGVSVNKLYQIYLQRMIGKKSYRQLRARASYRFVARGLTYTWFAFCMVCFWAGRDQILDMVHSLGPSCIVVSFLCLLMAAIILLNPWEELVKSVHTRLQAAGSLAAFTYLRAVIAAALVFGCVAAAVLTRHVDSGIIYQAF